MDTRRWGDVWGDEMRKWGWIQRTSESISTNQHDNEYDNDNDNTLMTMESPPTIHFTSLHFISFHFTWPHPHTTQSHYHSHTSSIIISYSASPSSHSLHSPRIYMSQDVSTATNNINGWKWTTIVIQWNVQTQVYRSNIIIMTMIITMMMQSREDCIAGGQKQEWNERYDYFGLWSTT